MKIVVTYEKKLTYERPIIEVSIKTYKDDDLSLYLFKGYYDYPANLEYELKNSDENKILNRFEFSEKGLEDAKTWASKQVEALRDKFREYESLSLPQEETYII